MRGYIRNRGKNTWQLIWDGMADGGKRQQRSMTFKGKKSDAEVRLAEIITERGSGVEIDHGSKQTLGDYPTA